MYQQSLPQLLDLLLPLAADPHPVVRSGAAWALVQFSEYLAPRVAHFHGRILPAAFALLDDPSPSVVQNALQTVECFFDDSTSPQALFAVYIAPFMSKLGVLLSAPGQDIMLQELIVAAVSSVASGAGESFVAYLPGVMPTILALMALNDLHHLRLRAK
jgi:vesicle coat complex subunit